MTIPMKKQTNTILENKILTIDNLMTQQECQNLIMFSENKGYEEATVSLPSGPKMIKGIRDNYRVIYDDQEFADKMWDKIKNQFPIQIEGHQPIGLNPKFRFYRYDQNQRFNKHVDGRVKLTDNTKNEVGNPIESRVTFMIYLNDDYEGGETEFEETSIKAKTGMGLFFVHELKHKGSKIISGTKYVLRTDVFFQKSNQENS